MLKSLITSVVFLAISTGVTRGADKKMIFPKDAPPNAAWSYGILADGTLYVSGYGR